MGRRFGSEGFGFVPMESAHHFLVTIPGAPKEKVLISEHFVLAETEEKRELHFALGKEDSNLRVILERLKWEGIAAAVRGEFNERLKGMGLRQGQWRTGRVPLSRLFGKELVLLGWAVEDADPALIPVAVKNWLGLMPEERWWLYTMTNAATGHAVYGRNRGWRKAVRYALTENPVSDHTTTERIELFKVMEEEMHRHYSVESHG
jgi:hypothetical protein